MSNVKTITDPKLQGHIDAVVSLYNQFATAMDAGDFQTGFADLKAADKLAKQYPEAWDAALRALDMSPDGTPIQD